MSHREDDLGFRPARGIGNPHLQTILAYGLGGRRPSPAKAEVWPFSDGESLDVVVLPVRPSAPCVLVLHGLEGSARAPYVRGLLAGVAARGWNGVAVSFPSCGPTPSPQGRLYHSGRTEGLSEVLTLVRRRHPEVPVGAVGFSMGGNILLKWLGEEGARASLVASVAVSVPFDLGMCAARLDGAGFFSFIYRERFLRSLRRKALQRLAGHGGPFSREEVTAVQSFAAFDEVVTARVFGFASARDYWERNSSAAFLARVTVPTLAIAAADDPFVPATAIPQAAFASNPALTLALSERGGHVGFLGGSVLRPRFWAEEKALAFLARHVSSV